MPEEHVSGATTQSAPPSTQPPTQTSFDYSTAAKWAAAVALAAAILTLDIMKIPADHFMNYVAIPGLAALGIHSAAKTLT
jgi:hypothetical protein